MSTIVTRSGKGSPLTHNEVDANFTNLNTDKIQSGNTVAALTITALTTPSVQAVNSAGLALKNSAGTTQMSMGAGGGDNMAINVSTNLNGTNAQIDISPTGTGHVHIKPTGVNSVEIAPTYIGEMDNITIGATTAAAGKFSDLTDTGLTSGRVIYATTGGNLTDDADFTFNGTTVTMANDASISGLTVGKGLNAVASNTAVGVSALSANTSGQFNTGVGFEAAKLVTTGTYNTAVGRQALAASTTADYNTAIGAGALALTTGSSNSGLGLGALNQNTTGSSNTAVGMQALNLNTTASNNTAVGYQAGYSNTTGAEVTAIGTFAAYANTTGIYTTAIGARALAANTTGGYNVAVGREALTANTTASNNTAVGYQAGYSNTTGALNTFLGRLAGGDNTTGAENTYIGDLAGRASTGSGGTFVGRAAGYQATTGFVNTFVGYLAGSEVTSGAKNTILGGYNGNQGGLDIRTASNYIVLSDGDGNPRVAVENNGYLLMQENAATATPATGVVIAPGSNAGGAAIFLGHKSGTTSSNYYMSYSYDGTLIGSITQTGTTAVLYNTTSDYRLKTNATPIKNALATVEALNPVSFTWIDGRPDDGFLAHEIQAVIPNCVTGEKDAVNEDGTPKYQQMDSSGVIPFLVKAIQELKAEVDSLKQQLGK